MKALNDICHLISEGESTEDSDGFVTKGDVTKEEVFCGVKSATRSEYFNAMRSGIHISLVFILSFDDYNEQKQLEYDGQIYKVERIYRTSEYYIELSCSEVE